MCIDKGILLASARLGRNACDFHPVRNFNEGKRDVKRGVELAIAGISNGVHDAKGERVEEGDIEVGEKVIQIN